jgi:predicted Ser/Thr protein kinase
VPAVHFYVTDFPISNTYSSRLSRIYGVNLGQWVTSQCGTKKKGKLIADRARRLEGLGIAWDTLEEQWEEGFALLENYRLGEGHCKVPCSYQEDGVNLGTWMNSQRRAKKHGKLVADRGHRLDDLGIVWGRSIYKSNE